MRVLNSRRTLMMVAASALVGASLTATACSSGSTDATVAPASASAAPAGSGEPTDGSNVRPDAADLDIMQADNGKKITMVVGQIANFPDLPEGNYEVVSTDEEVAQGIGLESLQLGAVKEGTASITIGDFDTGEPVLQFDVEVIPAD